MRPNPNSFSLLPLKSLVKAFECESCTNNVQLPKSRQLGHKNTYESEKQLKILFQEKKDTYHEVTLPLHTLILYKTKRERLQGHNKLSEILRGAERT
jgi:hypothetical protein